MNDKNEKKLLEIENDGEEETDVSSTGIALGLCFGSAFGLLIQVITGEVMWLPMGVAVGFGLAVAIGSIGKSKK
ncbi:MAG: hypothetical protein K2M42_05780 [Oscillospiraceae bacterium]|nr:hypothetical protein [Oscillospiraceae bacterium]